MTMRILVAVHDAPDSLAAARLAVAKATPEAAVYTLNWLSATGTGILIAALIAGFVMGKGLPSMVSTYGRTTSPPGNALAVSSGIGFRPDNSG